MIALARLVPLCLAACALTGPRPEEPRVQPAAGPFRPVQLAFSSDGRRLFARDAISSAWVDLDLETFTIKRGAAPTRPNSLVLAFSADGRWRAAVDGWNSQVAVWPADVADNLAQVPEQARRIAIDPRPQALAFTPDGRQVVVACDIPGSFGRTLCFVDLSTGAVERVVLAEASNLRGVAVDPGGQFALVTHLVPKFRLPSTQIEQGWVFVNALSYVTIQSPRTVLTLPLDLRTRAFANPEGVAIAADGQTAYVTHAGADLASVINVPRLKQVVAEAWGAAASVSEPAVRPQRVLADFRLTRRYVRMRIAVDANPGAVAVSPDSKFVAIANRLAGTVWLIDGRTGEILHKIPLGSPPSGDAHELGERLFYSGRLALLGQFSCASCHPDGHTDGISWDLPADGFNNFHNTKTLFELEGTAPYGWLGTSPDLPARFSGTLRHLFGYEPPAAEIEAIDLFLKSLTFPSAVSRPDAVAKRVDAGRRVFEEVAGCAECHRGAKLTDRAVHDVGTGSDGEGFDTPSLRFLEFTAPYLHDGRAATLEEVFLKHNPRRMHGAAHELTSGQWQDLVGYLKSL